MTGFMPQRAETMTWTKNALGAEVTRVFTNGAVLTVVRGKKGDLVPDHGYTHGAVSYVVSGELEIDGTVLHAGDAGSYRGGSGYYSVKFLTDADLRRRPDRRGPPDDPGHRRTGGRAPRRLIEVLRQGLLTQRLLTQRLLTQGLLMHGRLMRVETQNSGPARWAGPLSKRW